MRFGSIPECSWSDTLPGKGLPSPSWSSHNFRRALGWSNWSCQWGSPPVGTWETRAHRRDLTEILLELQRSGVEMFVSMIRQPFYINQKYNSGEIFQINVYLLGSVCPTKSLNPYFQRQCQKRFQLFLENVDSTTQQRFMRDTISLDHVFFQVSLGHVPGWRAS